MLSYRRQQAPWNFECQYKNYCPHLEGLSTKWIFEEYQRSHDEHLEHWKVRQIQQEELEKALEYIGKLEKENEVLNAKFKALHQRQFKSNKNCNRQSSNDKTDNRSEPVKKKRGAPKGHKGWFRRKPDHVDKTVVVAAPELCPHCACDDLSPME